MGYKPTALAYEVLSPRNGPTPAWTSERKKFNQSKPRSILNEEDFLTTPAEWGLLRLFMWVCGAARKRP